jgi:hypothetical protein
MGLAVLVVVALATVPGTSTASMGVLRSSPPLGVAPALDDRHIPRDDRIEGWSWHLPTDMVSMGRNFVHDGWHLYTSPLRLSGENALRLLAATAGFAALYSVDQELYDAVHRNAHDPPYEYVREAGDFFEPLGYQGDSNQVYLAGIVLGYVAHSSFLVDVSTDILRTHVLIAGPKEFMNTATGRRGPLRDEGPRSFEFNDGRSLPSGHSLAIAVTAEVLAHHVRWLPFRIAVYAIEGTVLLQRISSDHHWPSDVFVGALGGHVIAAELLERREERRVHQRRSLPGQDPDPAPDGRAQGLDLRLGVGPGLRGGLGLVIRGSF